MSAVDSSDRERERKKVEGRKGDNGQKLTATNSNGMCRDMRGYLFPSLSNVRYSY